LDHGLLKKYAIHLSILLLQQHLHVIHQFFQPKMTIEFYFANHQVERKKNIFDLMCTRLPHNTEQRLAARILQILAARCKINANHVILPGDINQVELARSVMTCRQTVNRILSKWIERGIITRSGLNSIIDINALKARIEVEF